MLGNREDSAKDVLHIGTTIPTTAPLGTERIHGRERTTCGLCSHKVYK